MSSPQTTSELFEMMPDSFNAEAAGDLNAAIQFDLTGDGDGTWTAVIADGKCQVTEGAADAPTLTLTMDANDFMAMNRRELNAMSAFMQGKIKWQGDLSLMLKIQSLFGSG